jgi:hypothetical protein
VKFRIATLLALALPLACTSSEPSDPAHTTPASASSSASGSPGASVDATATSSAAPVLPKRVGAPVVDLAGVTTLAGPLPEGAARVAAVRWSTRVHARRDRDSKVLGFMRSGAVVKARGGTSGATKGCKDGWRGIEPAGFVCMNDVTEDMDHEVVRAIPRPPDYAHRLPYMYGTVTRGGPVYARIPTSKHLKEFEPNLRKHYKKWRNDKVSGANYGLDVWLRSALSCRGCRAA